MIWTNKCREGERDVEMTVGDSMVVVTESRPCDGAVNRSSRVVVNQNL